MKKQKEYIYSINNFKLIKKDYDIIFKALDFYAVASIIISDDNKLSNRVSDLSLLLKQHCVKEEI